MERRQQLQSWLAAEFPGRAFEIAPASADASFRRYFRVSFADDPTPLIVMDAPPSHEDCRPYIRVAELFGAAGAHVPQVIKQNLEQGFLLLSDLGSTTYLQALTKDNAHNLYADALGALICIQKASRPDVLPEYDRALLMREMELFPVWYVARDYHSRNLMVTTPNPGVLDFQDAVYGPMSYDLASLFKDAYIHWEEDFALDMLARYWETARALGLPVRADFAEFHRDYEWMGVQRHIKVLGIFARLYHRDGKDGYLKDMPLVLHYLRKACERYGELRPLLRLLEQLEPTVTEVGYSF